MVLGLLIGLFSMAAGNAKKAKNIKNNNYKTFKFSDFDSLAVSGVDPSDSVRTSKLGSFLKNSGIKNMDRGFLDSLEDALLRFYTETRGKDEIKVLKGYISPQLFSFLESVDKANENEYLHMTGQSAKLDISMLKDEDLKILENALRSKGFKHFGYGDGYIFVSSISNRNKIEDLKRVKTFLC